jgi:predicted AlkP superfamily phosphohydrolase/phosphomutase
MDRYDWDFLFVEFQKTDAAVHKFSNQDRIRRIYKRVDDCMADILAAVEGQANVFVVSDHGIGQKKEWSIALNTWLVEQGYAATTTGKEIKSEAWLNQATGGAVDTETNKMSLFGQFVRRLSDIGLTKQRLERFLGQVGLYELVVRLAPEGAGDSLEREIIDRQQSKAFYEGIGFSGVDIGVIINDNRFYEDGLVSEDEYDTLREQLMAELTELSGPDGQQAFTDVQPRENVYEGDHVFEAPDRLVQLIKEHGAWSEPARLPVAGAS